MLIRILLLIHFMFVQTVKYQKPVAEKVWSVRCKKNEHVLNDCNWCWCGQNHRFECKARVCEEVDTFGHFKDTILNIDVGMEGHGAWRSRPTSCTPGIHYQRGKVLCICDEDGSWPNPVCRDLFRILHSVEVTEKLEESTTQTCSPTKLYLVGCNTCVCPSSGKLDAHLCTNRTCSDGDPVLEPKEDNTGSKEIPTKTKDIDVESKEVSTELKDIDVVRNDSHKDYKVTDAELMDAEAELNGLTKDEIVVTKAEELEIYAQCSTQKKYAISSQNCDCLTNNRLVCKEYDENIARGTKAEQDKESQSMKSICSGKIGTVIKMGCNLCKCTSRNFIYCTTKKCLPRNKRLSLVLRKVPKFGTLVTPPMDDLYCVPGTSYKRGCNRCYCKVQNGKKIFGCTIRACRDAQDDMATMVRDCVSDTTYETDCFVCTCSVTDGVKHEVCEISPQCQNTLVLKKTRIESLDSLHGHCEPHREYKNGCNTCRCLSDGKIVKCTTRPCAVRTLEPVEVEIVPFQQTGSEQCPKGHSYKVGCNLCFCLSNGNALCTTSDCSKQID